MIEASFEPSLEENVAMTIDSDTLHELRVELWWLENHPEQAYMFEATEVLNERGRELRQKIAELSIECQI